MYWFSFQFLGSSFTAFFPPFTPLYVLGFLPCYSVLLYCYIFSLFGIFKKYSFSALVLPPLFPTTTLVVVFGLPIGGRRPMKLCTLMLSILSAWTRIVLMAVPPEERDQNSSVCVALQWGPSPLPQSSVPSHGFF